MFQVGVKDAAKFRRSRAPAKARLPKGAKSETSLHIHVAGLLNKHLAPPAWWTTFPAGGGGEMRGKILKSMGLKAGVPDIWIIVPVNVTLASGASSLMQLLHCLELKKFGKGDPSETQLKTQTELAACGVRVANCDNYDAVKAILSEWQIPFRATSAMQDQMSNILRNTFANV